MSCNEIAVVLLVDDDTVRRCYGLYGEAGLAGLARLGCEGRQYRLSEAQQTELKAWITDTLPRSPGAVGGFIAAKFGVEYQAKPGLIGDAVHPTHQARPVGCWKPWMSMPTAPIGYSMRSDTHTTANDASICFSTMPATITPMRS
jgi:hypothetical protein